MIRTSRKLALAPLVLLLAAGSCDTEKGEEDASNAAVPTEPTLADIASCYEAVEFPDPAPPPDRAVFVLLDETTGLDEHLREQLAENAALLARPGTHIALYRFSDTARGHHIVRDGEATIEAPLAESLRNSRPVNRLNALDGCLARQQEVAAQVARADVMRATEDVSAGHVNSEIMGSLIELSRAVRQAPGRDTLVLLASDMLEHSSATSFYASRDLRLIDADAELAKAERHGLTGDFDGARVAVIGAGLLPPDAEEGRIRSVERRGALKRFWEGWFAASDAELVAWGEPDLSAPVR